MSTFTSIDPDDLTSVNGGVSGEGSLTVPGGSGTVKVDTATPANPQASDPNAYIRCLDLVGKQGGMFEAPNAMAARQQQLCSPLLGK
ncbi:MAG: hypothetical protein IPL61_02795 [Myxococcales bacterium]|nr:hypothetical protein [Myxococcales bacterium]